MTRRAARTVEQWRPPAGGQMLVGLLSLAHSKRRRAGCTPSFGSSLSPGRFRHHAVISLWPAGRLVACPMGQRSMRKPWLMPIDLECAPDGGVRHRRVLATSLRACPHFQDVVRPRESVVALLRRFGHTQSRAGRSRPSARSSLQGPTAMRTTPCARKFRRITRATKA